MENNVFDLVTKRKIKALEQNVAEMAEVTTILKSTIQSLTKFNKYSSIKKEVGDLFLLYTDIKQARAKKLEILERLKNEQ